MSDILAAIRSEANSLEQQLQSDPRYLKLQRLRELEALYDSEASASKVLGVSQGTVFPVDAPAPPSPVPAPTQANVVAPPVVVAARFGRAPSPERIQALEQAAAFIKGRASPTKTSDILTAIEATGVKIGGEVPVGNLSAMLSRSKQFLSHGKAGWTYVDETSE